MRHDTFETDFMGVVKGMPDLERIVSRIHAGTCKVKDFLKILDVRMHDSRGLESSFLLVVQETQQRPR